MYLVVLSGYSKRKEERIGNGRKYEDMRYWQGQDWMIYISKQSSMSESM